LLLVTTVFDKKKFRVDTLFKPQLVSDKVHSRKITNLKINIISVKEKLFEK
jgi:hypothetical protein